MRNGSWSRFGFSLALLAVLLASSSAQAQLLTRNLIYNSTQPCRVFDTRSATAGMLLASVNRTFNIVGSSSFTSQGGPSGGCALPGFGVFNFPRVQAVVISLAVVNPAGGGVLQAWPTDQPMPGTSVMNYTTGTTLANTIVIPVRQDAQGADITVRAGTNTHLLGDVTGYFSEESTVSSPNGHFNIFLGRGTGSNASSATFNVGIGRGSLGQLATGFENVAIGPDTLGNIIDGRANIAIGSQAGLSIGANRINNIDIGNSGDPSDNGVIRIGTAGTQTSTFIAGINGVTSSSGTAVYVNSSGQLGTFPSSLRFKEDVADMGDASQGLMQLRPVTFYYKPQYDDGSRVKQYGLVAEEVAKVYPGLVQYDEEGRPLAVRYQFVNAMLLNEVQNLHRQVEQLQVQIEEMKRQGGAVKQ
jgi:hypothetical protein